MSATIHYPARFAAEGGHGATLPTVSPVALHDCTSGAMTLAMVDGRWVIADAEGQVYAESQDPGDLAEWLREFAATMGRMHRDGEL